ncbi:nucleolar protein 6-like [Pistacia vera]|uniref:nucleolar protein 6-like n=1 Tax=Pistacia vera TaxID=55513 RepID=UPI001262D47D|nr:nucleolar protein 6-like [Pistacia vera]
MLKIKRRFRRFWGEKAELRRYKDGTIAESTVWGSEQWTRHLILKRIIEYVFQRHLSLPKENIVQIVDQLDFSLLHGSKGIVRPLTAVSFVIFFFQGCFLFSSHKKQSLIPVIHDKGC